MKREDDYEGLDEGNEEDWTEIDKAIQAQPPVRNQRRRDWRDVERFREAREMKKFLSTQEWFDDLDRGDTIR